MKQYHTNQSIYIYNDWVYSYFKLYSFVMCLSGTIGIIIHYVDYLTHGTGTEIRYQDPSALP